MSDSAFYFIDGEPGTQYEVTDRAYAFGDGVFETMLVQNATIPLWHYHRERLTRGLDCLKIHSPIDFIEVRLKQALAVLAKLRQNAVLKLIISRGHSSRGYGVAASMTPVITVAVFPETLSPTFNRLTIPDLQICTIRLGAQPVLAGIKHLNRIENVLAKIECQENGYQDGLIADQKGNVIEATSSNLFFLTASGWQTPAITDSGVAGVIRELLLKELMPAAGLSVAEQPLPMSELPQVSAMFLTNAVAGIQSVQRLLGRSLDKNNSIQKLQDRLSLFISETQPGALGA